MTEHSPIYHESDRVNVRCGKRTNWYLAFGILHNQRQYHSSWKTNPTQNRLITRETWGAIQVLPNLTPPPQHAQLSNANNVELCTLVILFFWKCYTPTPLHNTWMAIN